ncbi:flagellar hook-length control protein FliK [Colwelliaceae bacterium MEBiC 14330]
MKSVNVLPVFVSQEVDSKAKDVSSFSVDNASDADFSTLVDQHISEDKKATDNSQSTSNVHNASAKNSDDIAANGKNGTDERNESQENNSTTGNRASDEQAAIKTNEVNQANEVNQDNKATSLAGVSALEKLPATEIAEVSKAAQTNVTDATRSQALAQSEQFISLLYHSDKTLTDNGNKLADVAQDSLVNSYAQNNTVDAKATSVAKKPNEGDKTDDFLPDNIEKSAAKNSEHKLTVFTEGERGVKVANRRHDIIAQGLSTQALQAKQVDLTEKNITEDQLITAQITKTPVKNIKAVDVASVVSKDTKALVAKQQELVFSSASINPIDQENTAGENLAKDSNDTAIKGKIVQPVDFSNKQQSELNAKLVKEVSGDVVAAKELTGKVSATSNKIKPEDNPAAHVKVKVHQDSAEKLMVDQAAAAMTHKDNLAQAQQVKSPVNLTGQAQALSQQQIPMKEQVVDSELQASDEVGDDVAYFESAQLSHDKVKAPGSNVTSKVIDNGNSRTISEIQAQAIQANQIKQSNEAYIEHQVSEVLNHNVAADTAQIQKNNVQLQQEVISIFKKDFADAVKDKVMVMINQKLQQFDITLDPPEFGNMQVRVNLQGEQAAVNFIVQNQQAKDALEENMHKLKNMLAEQGVDVGGANVEQQNQGEHNAKDNTNNSSSFTSKQDDEVDVKQILSAKLFDSSATGIDYYA